ncbi:MAG: metallophosphoesterase [Thioalkalivibrio sp.]|nr:metallophosphoesterase [Thioalkalivibrio sp.]
MTTARNVFTVVQISDPHLGLQPGPIRTGYPDSDAQLAAVLDDALRHQGDADLALVTGDLAEDPVPAVYQRLIGHLARLPAPMLALAGNHDDRGIARDAFVGAGHGFEGERVLGDWLVIGLDSCWPGHTAGWVQKPELERLADSIERHPGHWVLVAVHHPLVRVGSRWLDRLTLTNGDEVLAALARHPRVRACIFGHIHQGYDAMHGSIRLLGCPSTLVQFLPEAADFALEPVESGYRVLRLHHDGSVETELRRVPGTRPTGLPA